MVGTGGELFGTVKSDIKFEVVPCSNYYFLSVSLQVKFYM